MSYEERGNLLNFYVLSMVITCQNRDIYTDNVSNFHSILLIMNNSISLAYHHEISAFCEFLQLHPQSDSVKWKIYRNIEIIFSNHSKFRQTHKLQLHFTSHSASISLLHCHFSRLLSNINTHSSRARLNQIREWVYANASKGNAKHIHNFLSTFSLACQLTVIKNISISMASSEQNPTPTLAAAPFYPHLWGEWIIDWFQMIIFPCRMWVWFLSLSGASLPRAIPCVIS